MLLNSSESSEDDDTPEGKDQRIKMMLKHRRLELKYINRFHMKKMVRCFLFYVALNLLQYLVGSTVYSELKY